MNWLEIFLVTVGGLSLIAEAIGLWARLNNKPWADLISPIMRRDGCRWLIIPWGWGVLAGHFFGPPGIPGSTVQHTIIAVAALVIFIEDLVIGEQRSKWLIFVMMLSGILCGAFLWSQA